MSYSVNSLTDGCYPGTNVLVNKLDIHNQSDLDEAETLTFLVQSAQLEASAPSGPLDFTYYKSLHSTLFSPLYHWAGQLRTVNISKKGTNFCPASELERCGEAFFARLQESNEFSGLPRKQLIDALAEAYHSLNMLHPFREGNGRTQRLFFTILIQRAGYNIDFSACDPDELMMATIYAAQGVSDFLQAFFDRNVTPTD
jgi:cell filamentation protein